MLPPSLPVRPLALALVLGLAGALAPAPSGAGDAPPPPDSPMSRLVRKLAATKAKPAAAPAGTPPKSRPELRFKKAAGWVMLPELAGKLSTNEEERKAVLELLSQGAEATRGILAQQGLEDDVAVATSFYMCQLWSFVHGREVSDPDSEVLLAQVAEAMASPEMAQTKDVDKQKYWEYCIGLPIFVMGMKEVATEPEAQADLKTIASAAFSNLIGVDPELVEIGSQGLVLSAQAQKAAEALAAAEAKAGGKGPSPPATPAQPVAAAAPRGGSAIVYDPPAGWSREEADWATIYRATLVDVDDAGKPEANSERRHAGAIFVLPPRPAPEGGGALFETVWREQFNAFELGDSFVHYRSRLDSKLVVHYMGRWFRRVGQGNEGLQTYGALWLVDLGDRVQPITATLVPGKAPLGMAMFDESSGYKALTFPVMALLRSVRPADGVTPHPAGGYFKPSDLQGEWAKSSSAFGGMYVYANTGASAGVAMTSSSGRTVLAPDGTWTYSFGAANTQPGAGTTFSSDKNDGTYVLDGDIVRVKPRIPKSYSYDVCAVGIGRVRVQDGWRRILALVGSQGNGSFLAPYLVPVGDSYQGVLDWMIEDPTVR